MLLEHAVDYHLAESLCASRWRARGDITRMKVPCALSRCTRGRDVRRAASQCTRRWRTWAARCDVAAAVERGSRRRAAFALASGLAGSGDVARARALLAVILRRRWWWLVATAPKQDTVLRCAILSLFDLFVFYWHCEEWNCRHIFCLCAHEVFEIHEARQRGERSGVRIAFVVLSVGRARQTRGMSAAAAIVRRARRVAFAFAVTRTDSLEDGGLSRARAAMAP